MNLKIAESLKSPIRHGRCNFKAEAELQPSSVRGGEDFTATQN